MARGPVSAASISGRGADVATDVAAEMRDGTILRADVYRPRGGGQCPALVCRTPYGKRGEAFGADYAGIALGLAQRGYIAIVQDVRGRYASDGEYRWLYGDEAAAIHARDGFDTTEWAAALPGCDGRVGTWGNSYDGYTALRTAGAAPPSLAAGLASGVASRLQDESRGIFEPIYLSWLNGMAADMRARTRDSSGPSTRSAAEREWTLAHDKWLWTVPYGDLPDQVFGPAAGWLSDFLREQEIDRWRLPETHEAVSVPVCHVTGWWDMVVRGTVANFQGLTGAGDPALRERHRLIIGPWSHEPGALAAGTGAVSYGADERTAYHDLIADWYDFSLFGEDPGELGASRVKAFVLNENRWRHFDCWPPADAEPLELHLDSGGAGGPGRLSAGEPASGVPRSFEYDPRDPVMSSNDWATRAVDQSPLDHRADVLAYLSEPLSQDLVLVGDVSCVLWAATDGVETDFTAKLVEVRPDGPAIALTRGMLRTRFLHGYDRVTRLEPGRPTELRIELGPVGVRLRAGSRIRLDVSSSDFPNFDRNHNTGRDFWSDPELRTARQTIFNDREHPSRLIVPVLAPGREKT
jgi:putative CocE/NonD family hydrolase